MQYIHQEQNLERVGGGLFHLQMRISFTFLLAQELCKFLLITRTRIFNSPVNRKYIRKVRVHLVQKYFPHDCSTYSISCIEHGKKECDEKNTKTRQQLDRDETV